MSFQYGMLLVLIFIIAACGGGESDSDYSSSAGQTEGSAVNQIVPVDLVQGEGTCYIVGVLVDDCPLKSPHQYQGPAEEEGVYWKYHSYEGERPSTWYECPTSYQVVTTGKIRP